MVFVDDFPDLKSLALSANAMQRFRIPAKQSRAIRADKNERAEPKESYEPQSAPLGHSGARSALEFRPGEFHILREFPVWRSPKE